MPAPTSLDIDAIRAQLPITERCAYFNTGWSGPLPDSVAEAMRARLQLEAERGPASRTAFIEYMDLTQALRQRLADTVGAQSEEIALTQNTTEGMNIVFNGLPWQRGDHIVTTTAEHSSGLIPCYYLQRRHGVDLSFVRTDASDSPDEMLAKFDAAITPGTKLVAISHISYSTGQTFPLAQINALAHAAGARVLVDAAQGLGHLPLNFRADDVDYYAMAGHKWLMGPDGHGALFIRRDLIADLEPVFVAHAAADSLDFAGGGFHPASDSIAKFALTSTSTVLRAGMNAALALYTDAGRDAVWQRICSLAAYASEQLAQVDRVRVCSPINAGYQCGLVAFRIEGLPASRVAEYLEVQEGVVTRSVSEVDVVRMSTHYFNTEAEIDRAVAAVRRAAEEGIPGEITGAPPWSR
jgi:L-cysteine/cystine lyase